jgi:hypothetical protein
VVPEVAGQRGVSFFLFIRVVEDVFLGKEL